MNVFILAFMKQQGKIIFTDYGSHGADCPKITRGQGGQGIYIMAYLTIVEIRDDIPGHVDENHAL